MSAELRDAAELLDAADRGRITQETATSLFVEAGAGSGKTHALVERVRRLVLHDGRELARIAAVTFTEKAGAELRSRLRAAFEEASRTAGEAVAAAEREGRPDAAAQLRRERADRGLEDLDSAAIGTLHSFAQRILVRHGIAAGLPPEVEVADEVASGVAFEQRWHEMRRQLLDDAEMSAHLLMAMSVGVTLEHLRALARAFGNDWDLVDADRVPPPASSPATLPDVSGLAARARELGAAASECRDPSDRFLERLAAIADWGVALTGAQDGREQYETLSAGAALKTSYGKKGSWPDLEGVRNEAKALIADAASAAAAITDATLRPLASWIAYRVVAAASTRRESGELEFHDLLVLTRELLRRSAEVRAALQQDYQVLLLDEFQDTDPIQVELAIRIAAGADGGARDWHEIAVPPGSLFVVGDPKQSIYRFRRADIRVFLDVADWFGPQARASLRTNFRTTAPVLDWLNRVFELLIVPGDGQPTYVPLAPHRPAVEVGAAVTVLGARAHTDLPRAAAAQLREREASDVAAALQRAKREGWSVGHTEQRDGTTVSVERPLRWGDVAVLVPSRTSLPFLEDALEDAGIPYRAESSSLVYAAPEVRALMAAARAVADASDRFAVVTALRTPLYGCGDDDLWTWKRGGGSFSLLAPIDKERADHPVAQALDHLRRLRWRARWSTPSEVLSAIVADRRMLEVPTDSPRQAREQWRRLRFVVDQARAWSEVSHGGLRAYLAWAARQADESTRVAEAILPETDVDAVRVMTVHAAKGLEFPVVVLSGMTSQPNKPRGVRLLWTATGYQVRLRAGVETDEFAAEQPIDEQMDALERTRLLYVAATRARDHLIVSLHRKEGQSPTSSSAAVLAATGEALRGVEAFEAGYGSGVADRAAPLLPAPPPSWAQWLPSVTLAQERSQHVPVHAASGLEGTDPDVGSGASAGEVVELAAMQPASQHGASQHGAKPEALPGGEVTPLAKGARDVDLPPWTKGRDGTAVGRAVHGVLQGLDLATGDGLEAAVLAQCVVENVVDHLEVTTALVRAALTSDLVRWAAANEYWPETFVGAPESDGTVLEGFIDLLVREPDGGVTLVDYKTDQAPEAALGARTAYYAPQVRAYARALRAAGVDVRRAVLLFLAPGRAIERDVALVE